MRISRPSFGRILREARFKIADALVNGKIIKITLGKAQVGVRKTEFTRAALKEEVARFGLNHARFTADTASGCLGADPIIPKGEGATGGDIGAFGNGVFPVRSE